MRGLKQIPRNSSSKLEDFGPGDEVKDNVHVRKKRRRQVYSIITSSFRYLMSFETRRQRFTNRQEVLLWSKLEHLSAVERFTDVDPRTPSCICNGAPPLLSITQTPSTCCHSVDRRRPRPDGLISRLFQKNCRRWSRFRNTTLAWIKWHQVRGWIQNAS